MKIKKDRTTSTENNLADQDLPSDILRENEYRYIQFLQRLPVAVYTCDENGFIRLFNDAAVALWGVKPEPGKDQWFMSRRARRVDGSPLLPEGKTSQEILRNGKNIFGEEIVIERPDGSRRNVIAYPQLMIGASGEIEGAVNMLVDINEQRECERALRQFNRMVNEIQDYAIIQLNKEGIIENWNKGAEKIKGYTAEEAIGKSFKMFYSAEDQQRQLPEQLLDRAQDEGKAMHEGWRMRKDGSRFWGGVLITAMHDDAGNVISFSKVTRDLTPKKLAEESLKTTAAELEQKNRELVLKNKELKRSEERFHRMVGEVQDYAILLLSKEGIIENWNKGAEKIKGYTAEEAIGKSFKMFYTAEDQQRQLPEQLIRKAHDEGKATHEGWRVRKDGSKFWGSILITALHNDADDVIGFSKVTRDLTDKKLADDALKASAIQLEEKNRELEAMNQELASFAYVSSHDLQEPLRKIQTFASRIMESETNLSPKGQDYFARMQNAAHRMQTLIEDLLAYSRTNTSESKFEQTNLNEILDDVKNDLKESIDEKHAVITSQPLPTLEVVRFQFAQLLTNVLTNAIKFSKPDMAPQISITYDTVKGHKINNAHASPDATYHHIAIRDNGIGFEPEHKHKIFEVFQRLHGRAEYGGTGIGLAICKKIMDNHKGMIVAESELGQGATFHLYFPMK